MIPRYHVFQSLEDGLWYIREGERTVGGYSRRTEATKQAKRDYENDNWFHMRGRDNDREILRMQSY